MRYSTVFAGISAFCSVDAVLTMPVTLFFDMESIRESGAALPYAVYLAYLIIACVCAVRSAKEAVSWIREIREYDRHVKNLKESGMFSQAVLDYYAGNTYCEGKVTVGTKYIFVEGLGRIIDYNEFQKIYARLVSYRSSSDWTLFEVAKDGTELSLGVLPYGQQSKKAYDEKILPMLNEIEKRKCQWSTEPV